MGDIIPTRNPLNSPVKTLGDLPNEVLLEIIRFVGTQSYLPRKYRVLYNISLVSRRLRVFAFPLLERDIYFPTSRRFLRVVDHWERANSGAGSPQHERLVRSISCGDPTDDKVPSGGLLAWGNCVTRSPFRDLVSFTCTDASSNASVLDRLRESTSLSSLTLVWGGRRELDLHKFRSLKSLRVYVEGPHVDTLLSPIPASCGTLSNLTKLVIHDTRSAQWSKRLVWGILGPIFPKLRVLRLDECAAAPQDLFTFIQLHSTLIEVNASMSEEFPPVRIEALKKLIEGTGTWSDYVNEKDKVDGEVNNAIMGSSAQVGDEKDVVLQHKDGWPGVQIFFDLFAFTRVPITETATDWRSFKGSIRPRYKATGLSFRILDQAKWRAMGLPFAHVSDVIALASEHFPGVEVLRISSDTECQEGNFVSFMGKVATNIRELNNLRQLVISWTIPDDWTWEGIQSVPVIFDENFLQLDAVIPPTERCSDPADSDRDSDEDDDDWVGKGHSLDDLRGLYVDDFVDNLIVELKAIHGTDEVDTRDENLYIRTWEAYNEQRVAKAMRGVAEACPTLEQIDWFPVGMDSTSETTRWRWTVHRRKGGSVRLMSGNLTWKGCTRDPAAAMHLLIGEELEYERTRLRRRW